MDFKEIQGLVKTYLEKLKRDNVLTVVQLGSSLIENEFTKNSDLDLMVIYRNPVRDRLKIKHHNEIEVNLIRRGRQQYLKSLKAGIPVDLIALRFGKVLWDRGFFKNLEADSFKPTVKTAEFWMHTASFNLSDAFCNYSLPSCMCCYFKALQHAARDFSRAIILTESEKLVEGNKYVTRQLKKKHPGLAGKYRLILDGRRNYESFKNNLIKGDKIRRNQRGRFLLACEDFAALAFRVVLNTKLPRFNILITRLQAEYKIDHFGSYFIDPDKKNILITLFLKNRKHKMLKFDLESI